VGNHGFLADRHQNYRIVRRLLVRHLCNLPYTLSAAPARLPTAQCALMRSAIGAMCCRSCARILRFEILQALHLLRSSVRRTPGASDSTSPCSCRLADRVRHSLALRDQNIDLPPLRDGSLRGASLGGAIRDDFERRLFGVT
jgi:hypothetical protein